MSFDQPILLLSLLLFCGYSTSIFFKKYGIPKVATLLLIGFIISNIMQSNKEIFQELNTWYVLIESAALGFIGFKIGNELNIYRSNNINTGKRLLFYLLLAEAGVTFLIVFSLVYINGGNFLLSITLSGLATVTAPAATWEIMKKHNANNLEMTRSIWMRTFGGVFAVILVESMLVFVAIKLEGTFSAGKLIFVLSQEIGIAIVIGMFVGFVLNIIIENIPEERITSLVIFIILIFMIGFAIIMQISIILVAIAIGVIGPNLHSEKFRKNGKYLSSLMSPILLIFFILVGARVNISDFSYFPFLAFIYLIFHPFGKIIGIYLGATLINKEAKIKDNLGFGLLTQGGVVIGLATLAANVFHQADSATLAEFILATVVISTIISEIISTFFTKHVIKRAGEPKMSQTTNLINFISVSRSIEFN